MTVQTCMRLCANTLILAAILVALLLATRVEAGTDSSPAADVAALRAEVAELKASAQETRQLRDEVRTLRQQQDQNWLNERRAEEVKNLVKEVLADADTRASLMGNAISAGHNGKSFFLAAEDGSFLLKIGGQIQVRYIADLRKTNPGSTDGGETGFQIRRAKLFFEGHVGGPKIEYKIQLAADRDTGVMQVEDVFLSYSPTDGVKIWGGRFQDRFAREAIMSSKMQQTVDRSAVANIFAANDDYVEGLGVEWAALPELLKLAVTMNDGLNSGSPGPNFANTGNPAPTGFLNGLQDYANDSTDIAVTARADLKLAGDWAQAADVESWSTAADLQAFLGAAVHYEVGETGDKQVSALTPAIGSYDSFVQWTVDGLVKYRGFGFMAAFYGWNFNAAPTGGHNAQLYAATAQAGYMVIPDKLEPFVRYEWIDVDGFAGARNLNLLTFGFNWFVNKHNAKLTLDAVWALNNINSSSSSTSSNTLNTSLSGIGLATDDALRKNQLTIRLQFQVLF